MALSKPGIDYTLNMSLEHMTLVKVVSTLLNKYFIYLVLQSDNIYDKWPDTEEEVVKQAMQLQLPHGLKRKVIGFIRPMFMETLKWKERFAACGIDFLVTHFNTICWAPHGTIDGQRTVRGLIENGKLDIYSSFYLACDYCLEKEISKIWKQIPEKEKRSYPDFCKLLGDNRDYVTEYWFLNLKGQSDIFTSSCFYNASFSIPDEFSIFSVIFYYLPNTDTTRYFLEKLPIDERKRVLVICAKNLVTGQFIIPERNYEVKWHGMFDAWNPSDVLCLLLSSMDIEQQIEVLRIRGALMFFLYWPYQDFFIVTANYIWSHLHKEDYYELLLTMCFKTLINYKDYNYQNLLRLFWKQSPNSLKSYVRNDVKWLLLKLIALNDKENIALILKDATIEEKETIILDCNTDLSICETLINDGKWDILEILVKGCISSKDAMIIFKEKCMERITCNNLKKKLDCFIENIEKLENITVYQ